jgi:hypothetical protein
MPTGQQMLSGAKATANFVEKNAGAVQGEAAIVTGNKPVPKKGGVFDPLTSLFGMGKKETKPTISSNTTNLSDGSKKGTF